MRIPLTNCDHHERKKEFFLPYLIPGISFNFAHFYLLFQTEGRIFTEQADIGAAKIPGAVSFDTRTGEYEISGSGTNMWYGQDEFHFA